MLSMSTHATIYPQNFSTSRVKPSVLRKVFASQIRSVASGSPRLPCCEQTLRCDFTHYSQSGGGSQMEPVSYHCLNCRGVWTHTYTRASLYYLIGVNNGCERACRFGISSYVRQTLKLLSRWTLYRIYGCSSAESIGHQRDSSGSTCPHLHLIFASSTSAHH